ncbi:serine/threonine-protein kinase [Gordonia polyisoprenivorans]|uniref:serine/threonine-protein kinase n=1 Tax=Gordonia polyisoprenivorans TaxID=84595 RepID=UPI002301364E|nr:serine/threonine protein kinase [Gordonia polyisoprenivorans]WCB40198.1 protein kinase [Gordonia polyisoprenivorans]
MVGQEFAGYRIVRVLGAGGMGEVYLAQHPRLPRLDALKVLPANLSSDEAFRRRFTREADLAVRLDHPNVVDVYDRGEHDGQLWITMRYVEGLDAAALLSSHPGGLPTDEVVHIVSAVADALDHAHSQNLLHRDVKPANILLTDAAGPSGHRRVLLADFGIARPILDDTRLTATNLTVGSFAYSSPEQLAAEKLDGRADQYSLACTAYQLLSGSTPFANTNAAALIRQHLTEIPPAITTRRRDLSPRVDQVLHRALEKEPDRRYRTCTEFATELTSALAAHPAAPTVAPTPDPSTVGHQRTQNAPSSYPKPMVDLGKPGPAPGGAPQPGQTSLPPVSPGVTPPPYTTHRTAQRLNPVVSYPAQGPTPSQYPPTRCPQQPSGYPVPPDPKAKSYAVWSMICAVLSFPGVCLVVVGFAAAALAVFFGLSSLKISKARPDVPPAQHNRGLAIAGLVVAGLGLVWNIAVLIAALAPSNL